MPESWSAIPFDDDGEEERDDLMEALEANSLPTLIVFDPLTGSVVEPNAVMSVQAGGRGGMEALIQKWRSAVSSGASSDAAASNGSANTAPAPTPTGTAAADDASSQEQLNYFIPAPTALICQYFKERLLSPDLPEALSAVVLRREVVDLADDSSAKTLAESLRETSGPGERWHFRTAAPALPMNSYGSSLGFEANALECWEVERSADNPDSIIRTVVNIENETGRLLLVFRETIVMEQTEDGTGTKVTKTLNLDGVPSVAAGAFLRRWRNESEIIFHALLGTCDRKKKKNVKQVGGGEIE